MSPKPWKWVVEGGSRKLVSPEGTVLEARISRFKPPSVYVRRPTDARAIELVPEMVERLRTAEIALRAAGILVGADRIKELLALIQG